MNMLGAPKYTVNTWQVPKWLAFVASQVVLLGEMLGGIRNSGWNPRTKEKGIQTRSSTQMTQEETKNLQKTAQASKVVSLFTRALAPPFYRKTKGLLHSESTLKSKEYS
jgi:uncharacterized membrane protein YcjF (UPF0283 family)